MVAKICQILFFLIASTVFIFLISNINSYTESLLYTRSDVLFRFLFSCIGTPIHELSHAIMCIIFGHRITNMKLLILDPNSNMSGYVTHAWDKNNPYQVLGNFFIGIAPILGGFITVVLIYMKFMTTPKSISFWIALLVCQQIIVHMKCSRADLENSSYGFLFFGAIIALIGCLSPATMIAMNQILVKYGMIICALSGLNCLFFTIVNRRL